jgi:outer membrane protein
MKNLKRLFVVSMLSVCVLSLNAQTSAGKILLGGSSSMAFGASTSKYKSDDGDGTAGKGIQFSLAPQVGFFVIDGLAVGLQLDLSVSSFKPDGADDRESETVVFFSPFVKYYYGTAPLKPFAEAAVGVGSYKTKEPDYFEGGTNTYTTGMFGFQFDVGVAYFLNDNVSLDAALGFQNISLKEKEDNDNNLRDITSTFGLVFGVSVVL